MKDFSEDELILQKALIDFCCNTEDGFTIDDVVKAVLPELGLGEPNEELVEDVEFAFLHGLREFITVTGVDDEFEAIYKSVRTFFENSSFVIKPTAYELENGILIPGHRFIPYLSPAKMAFQAELSEKGLEPIWKKRYEEIMPELEIYFNLLGHHRSSLYFHIDETFEHFSNPFDVTPDSAVHITVFDMAKFYKKHQMVEGDCIRCTVKNWRKAELEIELLGANEIQQHFAQIHKHVEALDDKLREALQDPECLLDVTFQLRDALIADPDLLNTPTYLHFGGYLELSRVARLYHDSATCCIGLVDEDPFGIEDFDSAFEDEFLGTPEADAMMDLMEEGIAEADGLDPDDIEAVEELMAELKLPVNCSVLVAWMHQSAIDDLEFDDALDGALGPYFKEPEVLDCEPLTDLTFAIFMAVLLAAGDSQEFPAMALRETVLKVYGDYLEFYHHYIGDTSSTAGQYATIVKLGEDVAGLVAALNDIIINGNSADLKVIEMAAKAKADLLYNLIEMARK